MSTITNGFALNPNRDLNLNPVEVTGTRYPSAVINGGNDIGSPAVLGIRFVRHYSTSVPISLLNYDPAIPGRKEKFCECSNS